MRDDVLARLLALNAECYAEELNLGLHSKGAKQAAKHAAKAARTSGGGGAPGGKRRGRPAKTAESADTEQIALAL